jgi:hypothetical protein
MKIRRISNWLLALASMALTGCTVFSTAAPTSSTVSNEISISAPSDGSTMSDSTTNVSGVCDANFGDVTISGTVVANDQIATCADGTFSALVTLNAIEGAGTLTISQSGPGGTTTKTISVMRGCEVNFVLVPANATLGTPSFCISKYEMKVRTNAGDAVFDGSNGGVALDVSLYKPDSRPDGIPWLRITQPNAILECASIGTGYHLVTTKEWAALARNAESVGSNWSSGVVGTGMMFTGHSDSVSSATAVADGYGVAGTSILSAGNGSDPYVGTGNAATDVFGAGKEQRRTFELSNGATIWDIAGNARDYNDIDGLGSTISYTGPLASAFYDVFSASVTAFLPTIVISGGGTFDAAWLQPLTPALDHTTNAVGQLYIASGARTGRIMTRGANFSAGNSPGVFAADFDSDDVGASGSAGFRCVKNL